MLGRRVGAGVVVLAVVCMIGLGGCNQDNTPKTYNTLTEQNFVELCTNHLYESTGDITDSATGSTTPSLDPALKQTSTTIKSGVDGLTESQCLCQYQVFVNQIPINKAAAPGSTGPNFTDLNSKLKTDPEEAWATLPSSVTDAVRNCASGSGQSTPATGASTTTTVAATTTTAAN